VHRVTGADASYQGKSVCASVVLFEFPELQTIEQAHVEVLLTFPYVPVLVSFREARATWLLWKTFCQILLTGRTSWRMRDANIEKWAT